MKIVVIGGTGLIGSKTVAILRQGGHEVVAASRKAGVNTVTREGLKEAIAGAQVLIDLSNAPSPDAKAVLEFFETSGRNLLAAEAAVGVRHHVALSIVGTDRVPDQAYYRTKVAQEKLIEASGIPIGAGSQAVQDHYNHAEHFESGSKAGSRRAQRFAARGLHCQIVYNGPQQLDAGAQHRCHRAD